MKKNSYLISTLLLFLISCVSSAQDYGIIYKGKEDSLVRIINDPNSNDTSLVAAHLILGEVIIKNNDDREKAKMHLKKTISLADEFLKKNPPLLIKNTLNHYAANAILDLSDFSNDIIQQINYHNMALKRAPFDKILVSVIQERTPRLLDAFLERTSKTSVDSTLSFLKSKTFENPKIELKRKMAILLLENFQKNSSDETIIQDLKAFYKKNTDGFNESKIELHSVIESVLLSRYEKVGKEDFSILFSLINLYKELELKKDLINAEEDIGYKFRTQKLYDKALVHFRLAYEYSVEINDTEKARDNNHYLASTYRRMGNWDSTLARTKIGIELGYKYNDNTNLARAFNEAGHAHYQLGQFNLALEEQKESLKYWKLSGQPNHHSCYSTIEIARCYLALHQLDSAKIYGIRSLAYISDNDLDAYTTNTYLIMAEIHVAGNEWKDAYKMIKKHMQISENIANSDNAQTLVASNLNHEFEQKQLLQKQQQLLRDELAKKDIKQKNIILGFVGVGAVLLVLVIVFIINRLRITRKQKNEIDKQKHLLEEKNKEITDSINYALRIQTAILPPQKLVKQYLENSFILYKPKDIVAGDFYWMETDGDWIFFAACDCTGHGVPGAMVSVVCHNALNRAVKEFGCTRPSDILNKTAELVIDNFSKSEQNINDGMDVSLCALNTKTRTLEWAGANNPLWILRRNEIIETKADKKPIGYTINKNPFTNHSINLEAGDCIYLFTDGYADQFGGETGQKKLTKKRFKDLILHLQNENMADLGIKLENFISEYRKDVEQIDDILVIGVKI